jgi:hypothetical protein
MADRRQILTRGGLLAAAVTAGASLLAASPDPPAERVAARARPADTVQRSGENVPLEVPARPGLTPGGRDLFGMPPAPPPPPRVEHDPVPPPPPAAPPLPFTLVGSFESEDGATAYYLAETEKVHVVKVGETIGDLYRLEAAAADQLELLYLPLAIKQTLVPGSSK